MALSSSFLAAKIAALSVQMNNLRIDVLGHSHDADVTTVDHDNLVKKGSNTHPEIDSHISANQGVHSDGDALAYIPLSYDNQKAMRTGFGFVTAEIEVNWYTYDVSFAKAFGSAPAVIVRQWKTTRQVSFMVTNRTTAGFRVNVYFHNADRDRIPANSEADPPIDVYVGPKIKFVWWAVGT